MKFKNIIFTICVIFAQACNSPTDTICGVPVKGHAWELAADIVAHGDATFIPECLEVHPTRAYIRVLYNTNLTDRPYRQEPYIDGYVPAEIKCECEKFEVKHAELQIKL